VELLENIPLAPLTTFKVGGSARYFVRAVTEEQITKAVTTARDRKFPIFILGGGSNLVIADAGWPGMVIHVAIKGIEQFDEQSSPRALGKAIVFDVGAGEEWDHFVAHAVAHNCAGIETLSGIPGTVGGTPVQNVGAYGQEVSETVVSVRVLDLETMRLRDLSNSECGFSYRTSIFNSSQRGRYIVLSVKFALQVGGEPKIAYADLQKHFAESLANQQIPTLAQTRDAVKQIRRSKAMLIVPDDEDCRSAGSFFKNPIVTSAKYEEVARIARGLAPGNSAIKASNAGVPPQYPAEDGKVKIPAAWLVERSGFHKGYVKGAVGISRKHSLAIINRGGATAADIISLKDDVQRGVRETFGIELQPEPVFVGF
jgi:UDP-N-acetylmuramate dehydrogenase